MWQNQQLLINCTGLDYFFKSDFKTQSGLFFPQELKPDAYKLIFSLTHSMAR